MAATSLFNQLLRLSKHSLIYGIGALVSQIVGFFLIPLYTRYLSPADYGNLEIFTITMSTIAIIVPLGVTAGLAMSYYESDDVERRKTSLGSAWIFLTVISFCVVALLEALAGNFSSVFFGSGEYTSYFRVIFLAVFFDASVTLALLALRVQERSTRYVVITLIRLVMSVGLNILFIVGLHKGVLGILLSQLITAGVIYLFLMSSLVRETRLRFSGSRLKGMISFGAPVLASTIATWAMTMADRYFLQFLSTPTELGLYSLGYKFGMVINILIVTPFAMAWGPFFWSVAREKNAKEIYASVLTYFTLVGIFIALVISVLSREVIAVMSTPPFYDSYKVIPFIALSYVLFGCFSILGSGILLEKKTKYYPLISGVAVITNLVLNYLLIPRYGMMGAAVATLVSYILLPIGSFLISTRFHVIKYEWGRITKILFVAGVIFGGSLFIDHESAYVAGVFKILALLTFPVLLWLIRFYRPQEIQKVRDVIKYARSRVTSRL
jgi:O-antigen/teichoic acid export membrane protein